MNFRRLFISVLAVVFLLIGCGNSASKGGVSDSPLVKEVRDSAVKLRSENKDYIISNSLSAPEGITEYIDVVSEKGVYTEFPVDADKNLGTLKYGSKPSMQYSLSDWLTSDGKYYIFTSDKTGKEVVSTLPSTYKSYVEDKPYLYINKLLTGVKEIKKADPIQLDLGQGEQDFTCYIMKVDSKVLPDILGASSYGLYKAISEADDTDKNIKKLSDFYLQDLSENLVFSDAKVTVGVDTDGLLRYVDISVGGLGSRLHLVKAVVSLSNANKRAEPDFTKAVDFRTSLKDLADFVSQYDDYDSALNALNAKDNSVITDSAITSGSAVKGE